MRFHHVSIERPRWSNAYVEVIHRGSRRAFSVGLSNTEYATKGSRQALQFLSQDDLVSEKSELLIYFYVDFFLPVHASRSSQSGVSRAIDTCDSTLSTS